MTSRSETQSSSPSPEPETGEVIRVRGARTHNLAGIDLDIPRDRLVVLTGPSGSGKSSLAFDTLYAEGQRQYFETLSVYARQFLHQLERPDVDLIEGLPPTICIDQRPGGYNPRSTVATVTEIYDFLRLLYARLGEASCHQCGTPIRQQTPDQIRDRLMRLPADTRLMLFAPLVRGRRGEHKEVFAQIRKNGFVRVRIDGALYDLDHLPELSPRKNHTIEAIVDRVTIKPGVEARLGESIRLALRHGNGLVGAWYHDAPASAPSASGTPQRTATTSTSSRGASGPNGTSGAAVDAPRIRPPANGIVAGDGWREELFSSRYACPLCEINYEELEPRTFSFNSPYGACPVCEGLGVRVEFDPDMVIPDRRVAWSAQAVAPWKNASSDAARNHLAEVAQFLRDAAGTEPDLTTTPLADWPTGLVEQLLQGDGDKFPGILLMLEKELATAVDVDRQEELKAYRGPVVCSACNGARLRPEARSVRVAARTIHEVTRLSVREALAWCESLRFGEQDVAIGDPLVDGMRHRLNFLLQVGVDYLTLDRSADTLSGGELQRVRLATSIGSGLVGVCYILDEPSIGLHPRDNQRLIDALRGLQRQGNSVLVVEHDEAIMRQADWLIDMGPGAGRRGGHIVAQGSPDSVARQADSPTGRYLAHPDVVGRPSQRRRAAKSRSVTLEGVTTNNLRDVSVQFPLGVLTCVTGVSGSGKSSLVNETLVPALLRRLGLQAPKPGPFASLRGASQIDKVIPVDQSPLGRTPRSNAATYTGVFDDIRKVFAETRESRQRGFKANRFSFNAKGGRCEACQGQGVQKIEMNFLPDLYVPCGECKGRRFNRATLEVTFRGRSIADVLDMEVDEALEFFANFATLLRPLTALRDVGLGYLPLGQPSTTLSGGEAQRVKLAAELARPTSGHTFYVLDEPTTGLHFDDIRKLLDVLHQLVDKGNTVLVIEHNVDVIQAADWVIDLGPEGGSGGGQILAAGTPDDLASLSGNATGASLASRGVGVARASG